MFPFNCRKQYNTCIDILLLGITPEPSLIAGRRSFCRVSGHQQVPLDPEAANAHAPILPSDHCGCFQMFLLGEENALFYSIWTILLGSFV